MSLRERLRALDDRFVIWFAPKGAAVTEIETQALVVPRPSPFWPIALCASGGVCAIVAEAIPWIHFGRLMRAESGLQLFGADAVTILIAGIFSIAIALRMSSRRRASRFRGCVLLLIGGVVAAIGMYDEHSLHAYFRHIPGVAGRIVELFEGHPKHGPGFLVAMTAAICICVAGLAEIGVMPGLRRHRNVRPLSASGRPE